MTYYAIRHKPTGLVMPFLKRNKGYSHWNPPHERMTRKDTGVPKLFRSKKGAQIAVTYWFKFPNAYSNTRQGFDGDYDETIDFKKDDRKEDDLEIIEVELFI